MSAVDNQLHLQRDRTGLQTSTEDHLEEGLQKSFGGEKASSPDISEGPPSRKEGGQAVSRADEVRSRLYQMLDEPPTKCANPLIEGGDETAVEFMCEEDPEAALGVWDVDTSDFTCSTPEGMHTIHKQSVGIARTTLPSVLRSYCISGSYSIPVVQAGANA